MDTLKSTVSVVCISDTHNSTPIVPPGDILIHAGDLTERGTPDELRSAVQWVASLPHPVKIVVAGNHDKSLDKKFCDRELLNHCEIDWAAAGIIYLEHSATEITVRQRSFTVFGSPFTPEYGNWAFQYPQAKLLPARAHEVWASIPSQADILRIRDVRPILHVFGHVHGGRGVETLRWDPAAKASRWMTSKLLSKILSPRQLFPGRGIPPGGRGHSLLVNASIQSGQRGAALNEPVIVDI
ncbi:hypothetical protein BD410DRAFT_886723 [Rickenella mellea]|uniref:Calcineurin-like phosphoesterase domain-containing protein n=1 Tax=Rickenella mellea TaxID=50990 RepID=A0A4Y7QCR7_9AGAM|nr:hypothetical protein BD410DRAFT_886723 [Rickenella mellea]